MTTSTLFGVAMALFFLLILGFMVTGAMSAFRRPAAASDRMAEAGRLLEFDYRVDHQLKLYPNLSGEHDGLPVQVWVEYPDNEYPSTFYQVRYPAGDAPAFVIRNRSWSRVPNGKPDGMARASFDEPKLDKAAKVYAVDPTAMSRFLTPARQQTIGRLLDQWKMVEITDELFVVQSGKAVPKDPKDVAANVERLVAAAETLGSPSY